MTWPPPAFSGAFPRTPPTHVCCDLAALLFDLPPIGHLYALQLGLELREPSSKPATAALTALLDTISALNKTLHISPADAAANAPVVQDFASAVFDAADAEDRDRGSDRGTARAFYAAVCFFEVCGYFGPLPTPLAERLAYARWKVADISKAVREGRVPRKGGPADWQREEAATG